MAKKRVLFRLLKGFIYGVVIGLFAGCGVYLLAVAVNAISSLPFDPAQIFALIFGASACAGVAHEYSVWLESQDEEEAKKA